MQITDHIHALKIPFQIPLGPGKTFDRFVYVYLVLGREICLVDSGVQNAHVLIFDYLRSQGRKPEEISLLVLTHAHPDHIGSARAIKDAVGCTVAAHPDAQTWIEDVERQFKERPVPGFHVLVGGNTPVDILLPDGEVLELDDLSLQVILTPGHADGAISLYCREEGVLFSGDAIPQENDLPIYTDVHASVQSIDRLKSIAGIKYLLASWTDPRADGAAYAMMDEGLAYLQCIHTAVRGAAAGNRAADPRELCRQVVSALGLPEVAVNPLVARSFASHLQMLDRERLR